MKIYVHKSKLINQLLKQEDTTKSNTITIEDTGKKEFILKNQKGASVKIKGTYHLGNLLQEVALLKNEEGFVSLKKYSAKTLILKELCGKNNSYKYSEGGRRKNNNCR